jgi:archaemetzincin
MRLSVFAILIITWLVGLASGYSDPATDSALPDRSAAEMASIRSVLAAVKPFFELKAKPKPGDWLAKYPESGQTFDQYIESDPNRPTRLRTTIYIQPLGTFGKNDRRLIESTADLLGRLYNVPVKALDPLALDLIPEKARRKSPLTGREQLLTSFILDDLLPPRRPADAVALLALTTSDLWPGEDWNFVFGQASLTERVGVWSSARYGDPNAGDAAYRQCLLRMLKVATHETGHMFGIAHCTAYECGMNGSNSLRETDRGPLAFCPECSAKIWWACGAKPEKWYAGLTEFAEKHGLKDEAALWKQCHEAIAK